MAQQTLHTDDIDGSAATHLGVEFEYDGKRVTLDLSEANHDELQRLQGALQTFVEAGTPAKANRGPKRKDSAEIRVWAQSQPELAPLLGSSGKGRLPAQVVEAYDARVVDAG